MSVGSWLPFGNVSAYCRTHSSVIHAAAGGARLRGGVVAGAGGRTGSGGQGGKRGMSGRRGWQARGEG